MKTESLKSLWRHPLAKASLIHLGLLGGGWAIAAGIASALGLSVSVLGLLLAYGVVNVALTAWLLRRRAAAELEPETDETADALALFAEEPLGALIVEAKARLARARKGVGRHTAMYQPLDRLVRITRKIERRLALEPELRPGFSRSLTRHLPLIATTAEQYVRLKSEDLSEGQSERLIVAEGVLREAGDRLDALSQSDGKIEDSVIGLIRMDANAEVLAEQISADTDGASRRAVASRASHALRRAAREVSDDLAAVARTVAGQIDALGAEDHALRRFVERDALALTAAAERIDAGPDASAEAALRKQIAALGLHELPQDGRAEILGVQNK